MSSRGHVPQRMCAGCGRRTGKRELIRFSVSGTGTSGRQIFLDPAGKGGSRGAYVCASMECFDRAAGKRGSLMRKLGASCLKPDLRDEFERHLAERL